MLKTINEVKLSESISNVLFALHISYCFEIYHSKLLTNKIYYIYIYIYISVQRLSINRITEIRTKRIAQKYVRKKRV